MLTYVGILAGTQAAIADPAQSVRVVLCLKKFLDDRSLRAYRPSDAELVKE